MANNYIYVDYMACYNKYYLVVMTSFKIIIFQKNLQMFQIIVLIYTNFKWIDEV